MYWKMNVKSQKERPREPWHLWIYVRPKPSLKHDAFLNLPQRNISKRLRNKSSSQNKWESVFLFLFYRKKIVSPEDHVLSSASLGSEARIGQSHEHIVPAWSIGNLSTDAFENINANPLFLPVLAAPFGISASSYCILGWLNTQHSASQIFVIAVSDCFAYFNSWHFC